MEPLNFDSYVSATTEDKNLETNKIVKKRKIKKDINRESFNIDLYKYIINVIDSKNINEIEKLSRYININKKDIIFEIYNNNLLTSERFHYIMKYCSKYLNVSSNLIKKLMKDENVILLDIIFSYLKIYDNDFILQLLFHYRNKTAISTSDLNQQISNKK